MKPSGKRAAISPARVLALQMLLCLEAENGPSMDRVWEDSSAAPPDAALAREIAYGVCRHRRKLEHWFSSQLKKPLPKKERPAQLAALCALYQLSWLEKVPDHAAVNEAVSLARQHSKSPAIPGLLNAVLKKLAGEKPPSFNDWRVEHSLPDWIASEVETIFGKMAEEFAAACNQPAPLHLRATNQVVTLEQVREEFPHGAVEVGSFSGAFRVSGRGINPAASKLFQSGQITVEDEGAQLAGFLANPQSGTEILDLCASPGGKAAHLADLCGRDFHRFTACDVSEEKLARLRDTLTRLGLNTIETKLVTQLEPEEQFDLVIVDAPCSGLGTLRRRPEIRWRRKPEDLKLLQQIQREILRKACSHLKRNGVLLYSVCTFTKAETTDNRDLALSELPLIPSSPDSLKFDDQPYRSGDAQWRSAPHRTGMDAFYLARFQKSE